MDKIKLISTQLIFFLVMSAGSSGQLLSKTPMTKTQAALSTRENTPQKYSTPTDAVKTFFTAFKDKDFDKAWESLSSASQNQFVQTFAANGKMSQAKARELFDKSQESVRTGFWIPLRDHSRIVPLVQDAVYTLTDQKNDQAMVEMKSGGATNHIKAVKEGREWRTAYVESALQDNVSSPAPPSAPSPAPESKPR